MSRFIDKRLCKRIFNISKSSELNEEEFHKKVGFVWNVMIGSGYECKCYVIDFIPFIKEFNPNWHDLYKESLERNALPELILVSNKVEIIWHTK